MPLLRPHSGAPRPAASLPTAPSSRPSTPHRRRCSSVAEDDLFDTDMDDHDALVMHTQRKGSCTSSFASATPSTVRRLWPLSPPLSPSSPSSPSSLPSRASTAPSSSPSSSLSSSPSSSPSSFSSSVTYIPPLVDAANGTLSRRQRYTSGSAFSLLPPTYSPADAHWLATATPAFFKLARLRVAAPLRAVLVLPRLGGLADAAESLLQIWLAVAQVGTLAAAPLLFLVLPGIVFALWLAACLLFIRVSSWPLNRAGSTSCSTGRIFHPPLRGSTRRRHRSSSSSSSDSSADSNDDSRPDPGDHWFFVSGMGATSRSLSQTLPRVAAVFGRPVTLVRPHTYGGAADFLLSAVLPRLWHQHHLAQADALYDMLYPILTTPSSSSSSSSSPPPQPLRIVVLAHNTGATAVAQVLARLTVDVPAQRLAQLEIYTFGSLAADFVLPRGTGTAAAAGSRTPQPLPLPLPHIEHIAHVHDPCARFGVLQSIREDLTGRCCGGAFVLGAATRSAATAAAAHQRSVSLYSSRHARTASCSSTDSAASVLSSLPLATVHKRASFAPSSVGSASGTHKSSRLANHAAVLSMEEYLTALFGPEPWARMAMDAADSDTECPYAPFLDAAISVDRELAERREMAAMEAAGTEPPSSAHGRSRSVSLSYQHLLSKDAQQRLSWTGLGATAKRGTVCAGSSTRSMPRLSARARTPTRRNWPADAVSDSRLEGLETARRLCKEFDGRPGREVSVLAGHYAAVVRHREVFGLGSI